MKTRIRRALCACALFLHGCTLTSSDAGPEPATPVVANQEASTRPAITALQQGRFEEAESLAQRGIQADDTNPYPHLVQAITRYRRTMQQLALDGRSLEGALDQGTLSQRALHAALLGAEGELAKVENDLAAASRRSGLALDLCLACWEIDWNGNGRIDDRDHLLLQIEQDAQGEPIPEDDPRRKPTFRFDDGDVAWARAFVSFERAALDVALAYDFSDIARFAAPRAERPSRLVLRLIERDRIAQARRRLLEGLAHSDAARRAYLAETDDEREWVPNPRQQSHPLPLPVDQALYDTWGGVLGDLRRLVEGEEGLGFAEMLAVADERMHLPVRGYLDLGRMLSHPRDIVLDLGDLSHLERANDLEGAMSAVLGESYVHDIKPSPLPRRLARMKGEIDRHEEGLARKLRYLFWLN
ncbi:MAG: hypothetical protein ABI193_10145 [Minicystis sp.]